jgi:hypothetical protein
MDMQRMMGRLLVVALLLAAAPAHATLGNGIRVGGSDGRLHPFLELELRYDSNAVIFYQPTATHGGDLILHVRPGLLLSVPGDTVAVDLRAALDWSQYFGASDTASQDLSALFASVSLGVGFNRKGQVGLELDEKFARSNQPTAYAASSGVISNYNDLAVKVPWRPGGGALTLSLNGGWSIESFEAYKDYEVCTAGDPNPFCNSANLADLGYNNVTLGLGVNWKFLPKTAALFDLAWFKRIPNSTARSLEATGLRVQAGVTGLVTTHLAATVKAGYGTTLDQKIDPPAVAPASLGTWMATVSAEWIPSPFSTLKLTWTHDLGIDPGTTYALYTANHVTLEGKSKFNSMLAGAVSADYAVLSYRDLTKSASTVVTVKPALQAELARWLMLELAYQYTDRSTDLTVAPPGWKYSKSEIWLRGVVTY